MNALMEYKVARGVTQVGLSYTLGISTSYLSKLLNGKRIPSVALARRIKSITGIPIEQLRSGLERGK